MSTGQPTVKGFEQLRRIAAHAFDDDDYRQRLVSNPKRVLTDEGLQVPDDVDVTVHQNSANQIHLVLPAVKPDGQQLDPNETNVKTLSDTTAF